MNKYINLAKYRKIIEKLTLTWEHLRENVSPQKMTNKQAQVDQL